MTAIDYQTTTWCDGGDLIEAVAVSWEEIERVLGHTHTGQPEDDERLVALLRAAGAPTWITGAEGRIDEYGWCLLRDESGASEDQD